MWSAQAAYIRFLCGQSKSILDFFTVSPSSMSDCYAISPSSILDFYTVSPSSMSDCCAVSPSSILDFFMVSPSSMSDCYAVSPSCMSDCYAVSPSSMSDCYAVSPSSISDCHAEGHLKNEELSIEAYVKHLFLIQYFLPLNASVTVLLIANNRQLMGLHTFVPDRKIIKINS